MVFTESDQRIDVRGQICPYPLIIIKETMKRLAPGQVLEVQIDSESTVKTTIPGYCAKRSYPFEVCETGKLTWLVKIQKAAGPDTRWT